MKRSEILATKVALKDIKADCKKNRTPVYVKHEGIITNILKTNVGKVILCD